MAFCNRCGGALVENAKFCGSCGSASSFQTIEGGIKHDPQPHDPIV